MGFNKEQLPDAATYYEAQGLKLTGSRAAKWKTTACNFHGGSDSMRVNTETGGFCCMSCGAKGGDVLAYEIQATGMEFVQAAKALGAWVDDGQQPSAPPKPTPLSPRMALSVLAVESNLTAIAAANVAHGVALTNTDLDRVMLAANRIAIIVELFQ